MKNFKKVLLTLLFVLGMALLGVLTGLFLPAMPVVTGIAAAVACAAAAVLGLGGSVLGLLGFCGGMTLAYGLFQPDWLLLAAWMALFLLIAFVLVQIQLRKKLPLVRVMLNTGGVLLAFGALSYIALNLYTGDAVGAAVGILQTELSSMEELMPQLYDLLMSMLSVYGMLPDVGLTEPVMQLEAQTRAILTASFLETFDSSIRMGLIDMLLRHAMQAAFLAPLMQTMAAGWKGEAEKVSDLPDLGSVRIPAKHALVLLALIVGVWVLMLFSSGAYAVYLAGMSVFKFVYSAQGLSTGEWFLKKWGVNRVLRFLILGAAYVILPDLLFLLGFVEQIFYLRGIGRPKLSDLGVGRPGDEDDHGDHHDDENRM